MKGEYLQREKHGPRINALLDYFAKIASGKEQKPNKKVTPDQHFIGTDSRRRAYAELLDKNIGNFNSHAFASIPFFIEETIRLGLALADYANLKGATNSYPLTFWSTSSADASHARTLAEYTDGAIVTVSDTPNEENRIEFERLCTHPYSKLLVAPYFEVTQTLIRKQIPNFPYNQGLDVIWEDTTFQMYSDNRDGQIERVKQQLAPNGLFILFEKIASDNPADYLLNEYNKDFYFKSRYFSQNEILEKEEAILKEMFKGQVTIKSLVIALRKHFRYIYKIWACGNFVHIVASNDKVNITDFLQQLSEPYTPREVAGPTATHRPENLSIESPVS